MKTTAVTVKCDCCKKTIKKNNPDHLSFVTYAGIELYRGEGYDNKIIIDGQLDFCDEDCLFQYMRKKIEINKRGDVKRCESKKKL